MLDGKPDSKLAPGGSAGPQNRNSSAPASSSSHSASSTFADAAALASSNSPTIVSIVVNL